MTRHRTRLSNNPPRPVAALVGGLSNGLFALVVAMQMVAQVFAAPVAEVGSVELATIHSSAAAVHNATHAAVVQQAAAAPVAGDAKVSIANFVFTPAEIIIAPGGSVTWTNDDGAPHGLAYHDGAKGTDLLLPGATFSRRYDQPGTYDYSCSVHPYMTGRVVVRAK